VHTATVDIDLEIADLLAGRDILDQANMREDWLAADRTVDSGRSARAAPMARLLLILSYRVARLSSRSLGNAPRVK